MALLLSLPRGSATDSPEMVTKSGISPYRKAGAECGDSCGSDLPPFCASQPSTRGPPRMGRTFLGAECLGLGTYGNPRSLRILTGWEMSCTGHPSMPRPYVTPDSASHWRDPAVGHWHHAGLMHCPSRARPGPGAVSDVTRSKRHHAPYACTGLAGVGVAVCTVVHSGNPTGE